METRVKTRSEIRSEIRRSEARTRGRNRDEKALIDPVRHVSPLVVVRDESLENFPDRPSVGERDHTPSEARTREARTRGPTFSSN